ncbi:MAG: hypothetical protein ACRDM2_04740 [Gaiellaceae bacterium]
MPEFGLVERFRGFRHLSPNTFPNSPAAVLQHDDHGPPRSLYELEFEDTAERDALGLEWVWKTVGPPSMICAPLAWPKEHLSGARRPVSVSRDG